MALPIYVTGIRDGEYITSTPKAKQNRGSLIQVHGDYPPSSRVLPKDDIGWDILCQRLDVLPFFAALSHNDRRVWLTEHAVDNDDLHLQDLPLHIKPIRLSGVYLQSTLGDRIPDLIGVDMDIDGLYRMIPRKPGSRAKRHTLVFRASNWMVTTPPDQNGKVEHDGPVVDIDLAECYMGGVVNHTITTPFGLIGIKASGRGDEPYGPLPEGYDLLESKLSWASPSLHKSLIQKIIRIGPEEVEIDGDHYHADAVLILSFLMLSRHPGTFHHDLRRHVGGLESALKRLAVSIVEDSFTDRYGDIVSLLAGAYLAQNNHKWRPTDVQIYRWIDLAMAARKDTRHFTYSTRENRPVTSWNNFTLATLILEQIGSFSTDKNMFSTITGEHTPDTGLRIPRMPIIHAIDQHTITDIAYYIPSGMEYGRLFNEIWNHLSCKNPRLSKMFDDNSGFVKSVRHAQHLVWMSKTCRPEQRPLIDGCVETEYSLPDSCLPGMVGPIAVGNGVMVCLHPDDIYKMSVVKRPPRNAKEMPELLSAEQEADLARRKQVINRVVRILEDRGIPLKNVPDTLDMFRGATLFLRDGLYVLNLDGVVRAWSDLKRRSRTFNVHPVIATTLDNAIMTRGIGIQEGADNTLGNILNNLGQRTLSRLYVHLRITRSTIRLFDIMRTGRGRDYAVVPEDTGVHSVLSAITVLYPGCLRPDGLRNFKILYGPVIWMIRDRVKVLLDNRESMDTTEWGDIWDRGERVLWDHQVDACNTMTGRNGHLIWIPVGMGKTMILMRYLGSLVESGKMPRYLLYTLPPSAIDNTITEVTRFGFKVNLMDMRSGGSEDQKRLMPYTVNLIRHDHLRMGNFTDRASDMIFVVDEFHLTMRKTLRTSNALELAKLSSDFVGMSGTVIQSDDASGIIQWLELIVDFEVTTKNFWVAVAAMVSKRVSTGIGVDRMEPYVPMSPPVEAEYKDALNNRSFTEAVRICHDTCARYLVQLTKWYIDRGDSVFLVAKDISHQNRLKGMLIESGIGDNEMVMLGKDTSVTLGPNDTGPIRVVITTLRHSTGYTITKMRVMLTSVYFSNQATRSQLEGRIDRIGQRSNVDIITVHTGLLTNILERYNRARDLNEALKAFADEIEMDRGELARLL